MRIFKRTAALTGKPDGGTTAGRSCGLLAARAGGKRFALGSWLLANVVDI